MIKIIIIIYIYTSSDCKNYFRWPTKMHSQNGSDVQFKIIGERKITVKDKIKPKVPFPCRAELGPGS